MSLSASTTTSEHSVAFLSYFDVVLVVVAAPIMLLIGVPAAGYLAGAGAWIVLRALGVAVERAAGAIRDARMEISVRLGYMLGRLFLLAMTVILVRQGSGKDAGLAALAVIVFAFTIQLGISAVSRPSRPSGPSRPSRPSGPSRPSRPSRPSGPSGPRSR